MFLYPSSRSHLGTFQAHASQHLQLSTQVWALFQKGHLFTGYDPEHETYRSRAHLAEMIALLGLPPSGLLSQGKSSNKFFSDSGESHHDQWLSLLATCLLEYDTTQVNFQQGYHYQSRDHSQTERVASKARIRSCS